MATQIPQMNNTKTTNVKIRSITTGVVMEFDGDPSGTVIQPGNPRLTETELFSRNEIYRTTRVDGADADKASVRLYHTTSTPHNFIDLSRLLNTGEVELEIRNEVADAKFRHAVLSGRGTLDISQIDEATFNLTGQIVDINA